EIRENGVGQYPATRTIRVPSELDGLPDIASHLPIPLRFLALAFPLRAGLPSVQGASQVAEDRAQTSALDDRIEQAVLEGELCRARWSRVTDRRRVHARPDERDPCVRLGQDDVTESRKRREHAAHGRIRQHREQWDAKLAKPR